MAANRRLLKDDVLPVTTSDGNKQLSGLPNYFSHADTGDRLIYEKVRLGIMSALLVNSHLSFTELKDLLKTSDGNLSVHARKLEAAGYISCRKSFDGRFPKTEYQLTVTGRQAFERYLNHMEALLHMARRG